MRFIEVSKEEIGEIGHDRLQHKSCQKELEEFMKMNVECVRIAFGESEYWHPHSARSAFAKAIKIGGFPVKVILRKENVYLLRTDI